MDQVPYSASWLSQWRDEITDVLSCMILDLLTFYESIGEVVLPDVGNGCFIHSARDVLDWQRTAPSSFQKPMTPTAW